MTDDADVRLAVDCADADPAAIRNAANAPTELIVRRIIVTTVLSPGSETTSLPTCRRGSAGG